MNDLRINLWWQVVKKTILFFLWETKESESNGDAWQVITDHPNYEINAKTQWIRNRKTKRILAIYTKEDGYQTVNLDGRKRLLQQVLASQFIPNPDPEHLTEVNHKNNIRNDNRLENLEWVTLQANRKDWLPYTQQKKRFTKELPEGCSPITQYKDYSFIGYFFNPSTEEILKKSKDRFQFISQSGVYKKFSLIDTNKVQHIFCLKSFVKKFQS